MLSSEELSALKLSLAVATFSVVVSLPFAIAIGFFLARFQFRGRAIIETSMNFSLVLPPVVVGYLLLLLFGRRGVIGGFLYDTLGITIAFSFAAAVFAAIIISFPLMLRSVQLSFQGIDQRLERAAKTLGASPLKVFFTVTLPLAKNGLLAGAVLCFARSLGEFGATIVFAGNILEETQTMALAIFSFAERPGGVEDAWKLVLLCVLLSGIALGVSQFLERSPYSQDD